MTSVIIIIQAVAVGAIALSLGMKIDSWEFFAFYLAALVILDTQRR